MVASIGISLFSWRGTAAQSASLMLDTDTQPGEVIVTISLSAHDAPLNAVQGTLSYSTSSVVFDRFLKDNSIISIWQPAMPQAKDGVILFAGARPGSFVESGGTILRVVFRVVRPGATHLILSDGRVYTADGTGNFFSLAETRKSIDVTVRPAKQNVASPISEGDHGEGVLGGISVPPRILDLSLVENPFSPEESIVSFSLQGEDAIQRVVARSRRFFSWANVFIVDAPFAVPRNAWQIELLVFTESGLADRMTVVQSRALMRPLLLGVLVIILAVATGIFMRRRLRGKRIFDGMINI